MTRITGTAFKSRADVVAALTGFHEIPVGEARVPDGMYEVWIHSVNCESLMLMGGIVYCFAVDDISDIPDPDLECHTGYGAAVEFEMPPSSRAWLPAYLPRHEKSIVTAVVTVSDGWLRTCEMKPAEILHNWSDSEVSE